MSAVDEIMRLFETKGSSEYGGERVSQLEHALQAAYLARSENAAPSLVVAALLHDIGHLLADAPNAPHEKIGHDWVAEHFPPEVSDPVKLHVAAKRYLCATDAQYLDQLSPASVESLHHQGGPMTEPEMESFEEETFFRDAVALRHWDDRAKIEHLPVPELDSYRETIAAFAH
jgi:gamma-butyrobetaine dioxygenase